MAKVTSLGVHVPVALPYLIAEGILPEEPKSHLYQWETYVFNDGHGDIEEEVLATETCVVWSQGKAVRNVYRFGLEGEGVLQALLTQFPSNGDETSAKTDTPGERGNDSDPGRSRPSPSVGVGQGHQQSKKKSSHLDSGSSARALVIFLKSKAHIHFLHGSHYIVDVPFEIARAFSAPRGVIVQRKPTPNSSLPLTPQVPVAPPNSFLSAQLQPASSFLHSPTLAKTFRATQPVRPSPLSGNKRLDDAFRDLLGGQSPEDEENLSSLYTLTSPLSEFGVVTYSIQQQRPRSFGKSQTGTSVEFEALDAAETVVYISSVDELSNAGRGDCGPLIIIVTANHDRRTITVWHAWYISEKSLASLLKQRAEHKASKARRRSSFLSASMGTGTATPGLRHRETTRESFAAAGSLRLLGDLTGTNAITTSSRKPTREEEEEAMASRMDPDYLPAASQHATRENRRISSLNTDIRASQHNANTSFVAPGARRNTSFGGPNERRSLGHRKSRGSTPGSIYSRSLAADDDLMDVDSTFDSDGEESVESVVRHIRATYDAAGANSIFGSADGTFKRELVVRKLHSMPMVSMDSTAERTPNPVRVVTLADTPSLHAGERERLAVYIQEHPSNPIDCLRLDIRRRDLWPELATSSSIAVPTTSGETKLAACTDIAKLKDRGTDAIIFSNLRLVLSVDDDAPSRLPNPVPYRMYNMYNVAGPSHNPDKDIGRNRTLSTPAQDTVVIKHPGSHGSFDEVTIDGTHHRRQMRLRPRTPMVARLLEVCRMLLPAPHSASVLRLWQNFHALLVERSASLEGTAQSSEWVAIAATILGFAIHLVDEKARAAVNLSRVAAGKSTVSGSNSLRLQKQKDASHLSATWPWAWLDQQRRLGSTLAQASPAPISDQMYQKDQFLVIAAALADELSRSAPPGSAVERIPTLSSSETVKLMLALHVISEEQKLCTLSPSVPAIGCLIAQLGSWLGLQSWTYQPGHYYSLEGASDERWAFVKSNARHLPQMPIMDEPIGVHQWIEHAFTTKSAERYLSLDVIAALDTGSTLSMASRDTVKKLVPRITALSDILAATTGLTTHATATVQLMAECGITQETMETLPEAIAAPFREAITRCEKEPPTNWPASLLDLVGREDLNIDGTARTTRPPKPRTSTSLPRDVQAVCHALEQHTHNYKTKEANRHAVSQLIFSEDRRLVDATNLMHFSSVQVAECVKQPDWSDMHHLEQQRKMMQWITLRMIALPAGDAMIHYDSQTPLLTDKYHLSGFSSSCIMQPMGHTMTTDRSGLTEEKVNWAYFHAGVSAGLRISKNVEGIDTSWIAFNKPTDLTNRHAGLLLALGLGGHLRHLAKWLSFKYLTPKHTMTSVGLLLGLSASHMGTMDGLTTRMLSVHITRMLPPGAADLNVSPLTQTAGLMGIGLVYYLTQHRRMSEIMLSEIEHMELDDPDSAPDPLRDESYRLAAGFALGFINLGKGKDLRGLNGMYLPERLLAMAVGPRPVNAVHIFDKATAGAVIAITLAYMKSGDKAIARKIDIPDTEAQFDHVRPDMLMLRAMANHIILWDDIQITPPAPDAPGWTQSHLPGSYQRRFQNISDSSGRHPLKSSDVPFFNIATGLLWALSLKYAGSGNVHARDEILTVLDLFFALRGGTESYYYDAKLARSTIRRCIDVLALSAATVMAGTGDVRTFRYLRRLHGRTDSETPYGSHLAAHLAIGVLFLGGGTYTFGTSNLATASLICAFYPLSPTDVHDNHVHLQAFRHFWVFAAEARCLVVEDIDIRRPIPFPVVVSLRDGSTKTLTAPCLLPELEQVASVHTDNPAYWRVTLDFLGNAKHLSAFRTNQTISVRRCPASEAHTSAFASTLAAMNDAQSANDTSQLWQSTLKLQVLKELDKADMELILPPDAHSSTQIDERATLVDARLALRRAVDASDLDALWDLRLLLAWAESARQEGGEQLRWIGAEFVEALQAMIIDRSRSITASGP